MVKAIENKKCYSSIPLLLDCLTSHRRDIAYDAILDITGQFRRHDPFNKASYKTRLQDVVIELSLADRSEDATQLQAHCSEVMGLGVESSPLFVLLLSARNLRLKAPAVAETVFGTDRVLKGDADKYMRSMGNPRRFPLLFSEPLGFDDLSPWKAAHPISQSRRRLEKLEDSISAAARSAMNHQRLWKQDKVASDSVQNLTEVESCSGQDFLQFVKETSFVSRPSLAWCETLENRSYNRQEALVDHVFCRCLSGADSDESYERPDYLPKGSLITKFLVEEGGMSPEIRESLLNRPLAVWNRFRAFRNILSRVRDDDEIIELTVRASAYGSAYQDIVSFTETYSLLQKSRALSAVVDFAYDLGFNFYCALLRVLEDGSILLSNKPWALLDEAECEVGDLCTIADILVKVENTDGSACAILDLLLDESVERRGDRAIYRLFSFVSFSYLDLLWDWIFEGSTERDTEKDFFGTRLGLSATASESLSTIDEASQEAGEEAVAVHPRFLSREHALFVLRAGRTRCLLTEFGLHEGMHMEKEAEMRSFQMGICSQMLYSERDGVKGRNPPFHLLPGGPGEARIDSGERCKRRDSATHCRSPRSVTDATTGNKQLDTGWIAFRVPEYDAEEFALERGLGNRLFTRLIAEDGNEERRIVEDKAGCCARFFPSMPSEVMFGSFMMEPMMAYDKAVQEKVLNHLVSNLDLFGHLKNLMLHALLGAGDFANMLVEQIETTSSTSDANERYIQRRVRAARTFYGTSGGGGRHLRDQIHLNRCFKTALNLSSASDSPLTDLISLEANPRKGSAESWSEKSSLWDMSMELKYKVDVPLNMIISEHALSKYSRIFDFFIRVLRAKKSLRNLFLVSRRNSVLNRIRNDAVLRSKKLLVSLWQFCWQAEHFVSIFGGFEMDQVLGSSWTDFEKSWSTVQSIWELREAHIGFLDGVIRRGLLGDKHKSVLGVMSGGFDIVVSLDKNISAVFASGTDGGETETTDTIDLLVSASASLKRRSAFLTDVLERLMESGTLPHLEDLLIRLNFNHYYQKASD